MLVIEMCPKQKHISVWKTCTSPNFIQWKMYKISPCEGLCQTTTQTCPSHPESATCDREVTRVTWRYLHLLSLGMIHHEMCLVEWNSPQKIQSAVTQTVVVLMWSQTKEAGLVEESLDSDHENLVLQQHNLFYTHGCMTYLSNHLDMSVCIFMLIVDVAECYIIHNVLDEEGLLGQERRNAQVFLSQNI